jgi:hypothetical protein
MKPVKQAKARKQVTAGLSLFHDSGMGILLLSIRKGGPQGKVGYR